MIIANAKFAVKQKHPYLIGLRPQLGAVTYCTNADSAIFLLTAGSRWYLLYNVLLVLFRSILLITIAIVEKE